MPNALTSRSDPHHAKQMLYIASTCLIVSMIVAAIVVALNNGFGARDIWSFLFWSIPFALGIASINLTRLHCRLHLLFRYLMAVVIGIMVGVLWTFIVRIFLGPWFGAFSFPVLTCWAAGGASGMVTAVRTCTEKKKGFIWGKLILVTIICLLATTGAKSLFLWSSSAQRMTVTFIKWTPGPQTLSMSDESDFEDYGLTREDINQLASFGLTGQLNVLSGSRTGGEIKHSRVIVVMQRQLDKLSIDLAQPNGVNVIYVQDENNNWRMYPANAPTLQRSIHLEIPKDKADVTEYWIELESGARQGGQAFFWE